MTTPENLGPGWNRNQVSFWLNPSRREDLMEIALKLQGDPTPSDAIARAIQIARDHLESDGIDPADLMDTIDAAVASGYANARDAIDEQASAILGLSRDMRKVHSLLAALADEEGFDCAGFGGDQAKPLSIRAWLDGQVIKAGAKPQRSAVALGWWHAIERASDRMVSVDFSLSLAAIDGKPVPTAQAAESTIARFELIESSHPFATADWSTRLFFVCQPVGNEWVIHLHRAGQDGAAGAAIGQAKL